MGFVKINRCRETHKPALLAPAKLALRHNLREYLQP
jgi:hypothetical protein